MDPEYCGRYQCRAVWLRRERIGPNGCRIPPVSKMQLVNSYPCSANFVAMASHGCPSAEYQNGRLGASSLSPETMAILLCAERELALRLFRCLFRFCSILLRTSAGSLLSTDGKTGRGFVDCPLILNRLAAGPEPQIRRSLFPPRKMLRISPIRGNDVIQHPGVLP